MKRSSFKLSWFWLLLICVSFEALSQPGKPKKPHANQDCAGNCFSAEVLSSVQKDGGCTDYEMRVSHNGSCRYELSHFTVDIPCGKTSNFYNSGGWANVTGKDPTTGLTGLKIDDIGNFGKISPNSFTVKFTVCRDSTCSAQSGCWQPLVAFKAATCVDYDTVSVSCQVDSLRASIQKQNVSCSGKSDGSLSAAVQGGTGPYTYSWSTGCTSSSVQNLPAGSYTVTITDANGSTVTVTEEITATSQISLSATTVNPLCPGSANGSIDLTVQGGLEPYTYIWSNSATTEDLTNVAAGSYQVTVMDSAGCSRQATFQLTSPVITVGVQLSQPGCLQSNGGINITVSGGVEPYTYLWSNGATSQDLSGLGAGSYNVTVTDANGCSKQSSFFLRENNTLRITFTVTPTGCVDTGTGAIDLTVTGGTAPYTYLWTNGSTSEDLIGLSAGLQRVTVTDAGGCTLTSNINVFKESFNVASQVSPPTCTGESNGSISLTPAGVPPYTYLWSTGATTSSISNLSKGTYSVTVKEATGCSRLLNFPVSDPVITASSSVGNLACGAQGAFSIDLTVSGGMAPYTYLWSNGETSEDLSGLNSGSYNVTITDSNGCSKTVSVLVEPVVINWSCLINAPAEAPVCGSSGNQLGTSVADGDSYAWSVQSDDVLWAISSGQNSASIVFTAGGEGSSATFTLAITKDGCTQTCSLVMSSCSAVMSCGLPLAPSSAPASVTSTTVQTAVVADTQQAADDKDAASAGNNLSKPEFRLVAYPNPVADQLNFGWTAEADEYVQLELVDMRGERVAELYKGFVRQGESYRVEWGAAGLQDPLYIYHYSSGTRKVHGKLLKR